MNTLKILPRAQRYLKKIKDKELKNLFLEWIEKIRENPLELGIAKAGDLKGIYVCKFYYSKTNYRIAYSVDIKEDGTLSIIILAGERENFYNDLKNYLKQFS